MKMPAQGTPVKDKPTPPTTSGKKPAKKSDKK